MTSVSYANVAAIGLSPDSKPELTTNDAATVAPVASESSSAIASESSAATTEGTAAPKKNSLAPAPVPFQSAWGSAATPAALESSNVDVSKWPTPDSAVTSPEQPGAKAPRFNKPNKWMPLNAKVVMPSPRQQNGNSQHQKNKRKSKTGKKKDDKREEGDADELGVHHHHQQHPDQLQNHPGGSEEILELGAELDERRRYFGSAPQRSHSTSAVSSAFNPNYKKYQNGVGQRPIPQTKPQNGSNGYSNTYSNGGNRQYRPNGAPASGMPQYRRNNSTGNVPPATAAAAAAVAAAAAYGSGYPMVMPFGVPPAHLTHPLMITPMMPYGAPMPVLIPPPISPKQDPQQALTQQIDYYFSLDNLIRDVFLRKNMGTEGWLELDLILNFKRVKIIVNGLSNSIEEADEAKKANLLDAAILKAVQNCENVEIGYLNGKEAHDATATEVQLRVKSAFEQWLLPDN